MVLVRAKQQVYGAMRAKQQVYGVQIAHRPLWLWRKKGQTLVSLPRRRDLSNRPLLTNQHLQTIHTTLSSTTFIRHFTVICFGELSLSEGVRLVEHEIEREGGKEREREGGKERERGREGEREPEKERGEGRDCLNNRRESKPVIQY